MKQFILAMLMLMTGCASGKLIVNGLTYPTKWVKTVEEVEKSTLEEKNASSATIKSNNEKRVEITIAYINTQYLPEKDTIKDTSIEGNQIVAKLTFNQKLEMVKRRSGVYEKDWRRDVLLPAYKGNPLVYEACKTFWADTHITTIKENNIIYSKDVDNYSLLTNFTMTGIKYTDKAKELPLEDACSVKSAELYLVEIAKDVAARTEEYINK